jgi:hypothetical protein
MMDFLSVLPPRRVMLNGRELRDKPISSILPNRHWVDDFVSSSGLMKKAHAVEGGRRNRPLPVRFGDSTVIFAPELRDGHRRRRHECRRGTHECVRHIRFYGLQSAKKDWWHQAEPPAPLPG